MAKKATAADAITLLEIRMTNLEQAMININPNFADALELDDAIEASDISDKQNAKDLAKDNKEKKKKAPKRSLIS